MRVMRNNMFFFSRDFYFFGLFKVFFYPEHSDFFYENTRNMKGLKGYFFASEQVRNFYTQDHEIASKNAR